MPAANRRRRKIRLMDESTNPVRVLISLELIPSAAQASICASRRSRAAVICGSPIVSSGTNFPEVTPQIRFARLFSIVEKHTTASHKERESTIELDRPHLL